MANDSDYIRIANESGFPFQIAVEQHVADLKSEQGWNVCYSEHAWFNRRDQQSGYIDIVVRNRHRTIFLVIECKRPRDATWVFLNRKGDGESRNIAKGWVTDYSDGQFQRNGWEDHHLHPVCSQASYCAVRGQSDNDRNTMIERIGGELISATEGFANEQRDFRPDLMRDLRFYFSVIVTTAELRLVRFSAENLSLASGSVDDADTMTVPFVRFRKQLSARERGFNPEDFSNRVDVAKEKESTIFVVQAEGLGEFLKDFELFE